LVILSYVDEDAIGVCLCIFVYIWMASSSTGYQPQEPLFDSSF